jgi:hypothetical protein
MPKMFLKLEDKKRKKTFFVGWSTISDSVNSEIMDEEYFKKNVTLTEEEQKSLDETGCSNPYYTIKELLECSDDFPTKKSLINYCWEIY